MLFKHYNKLNIVYKDDARFFFMKCKGLFSQFRLFMLHRALFVISSFT